MKKLLVPVALVVCFVMVLLTLPVCAPAPAPAPAPAEKWEWPDSLLFGTQSIGTSNHAVTAGVAPVLEKTTGMRVRVIPESISDRILARLYAQDYLVAT